MIVVVVMVYCGSGDGSGDESVVVNVTVRAIRVTSHSRCARRSAYACS